MYVRTLQDLQHFLVHLRESQHAQDLVAPLHSRCLSATWSGKATYCFNSSLCCNSLCVSNFSRYWHVVLQRGVLDFMALSLGIACSFRPARHRLTTRPAEQSLCMAKHFIMLTMIVFMLSSVAAIYLWYMTTQPWYTGGNSSSKKVRNDSLQAACTAPDLHVAALVLTC